MVDFASPYHILLGQPCYTKFMVVPHYSYLKLKMPTPRGVITVTSSTPEANLCEQKGTSLAMADIATTKFAQI